MSQTRSRRRTASIGLFTVLCACASSPQPETQSPTPPEVVSEPTHAPRAPERAKEQAPQAPEETPVPDPTAKQPARPGAYDGDKTSDLTAKVGETIVIALPANITTPFKWSLDNEPNASVVKLTQQAYTDAPPAGCDGCVGYGGTATFTFECTGTGEETLVLAYRGLGKKDAPPKRSVAIHLTVK